MTPHKCEDINAEKFMQWIKTRGGLACWRSLDIGNPKTWTAPLKAADGSIKDKPFGFAESQPYRIITSSDDVLVYTSKQVRRVRVALQRGYGFNVELTPASTRKVRAAVEKAGEDAYYEFDHDTQEAVIMAPTGKAVTLTDWWADKHLTQEQENV